MNIPAVSTRAYKEFIWIMSLLQLLSCGGKVADLSASSASVSNVTIVSNELTGIVVGEVSSMISTSGGIPPLHFTISGGTLPTGLKVDPVSGLVSGTIPPEAANQSYAVTVSVTDSAALTSTKTFSGVVSPGTSILTLHSPSIADFTAGISYSYPLVVLGGEKPYKFSITTGSLPAGVAIDATEGLISGTPEASSANQAFAFEVTIQDNAKQKVSKSFSGSVAPGSALLVNYSKILADFVAGVSYNYPLMVTGGTSPYSFTVASGTLPSGITLNATTGVLSGTPIPLVGGTSFAFEVKVSDSKGQSVNRSYSGSVGVGSSLLTNHSNSISDFIAGIPYSYPIIVTGGNTPYTFSITSGALPTGISLNTSTGMLSGTTSAAIGGSSFAFLLRVQDAGGQTITKTYLGTVQNSNASSFNIITGTLPNPTAGAAYGASIGISGGAAPFSFAITNGALPSGLSLNTSTGLISGTVGHSAQGSAYLFAVTASDSASLFSVVTYTGFVTSYTTALLPAAMPAATPGQGYNVALTAVNGQAPYTYTITSGTLPSGLSLNTSTGIIGGTVSEAEAGLTKAFSVKSRDTNGIEKTENYSIFTNSFDITMLTTSLAVADEGSVYSNNSTAMSASGGSAPYSYEFTGTLPAGVGLTSSGVFFGTPSSGSGSFGAGTDYTVNVRARDSLGRPSALKVLTLNVAVTLPSVVAGSLDNAVLGSTYSQTLTATGGRPPYTFAVTAGSLPTGITLSSNGTLSGSAAASATCPTNQFSVRVTDFLNNISAATLKCITTVNGVSVSNTSFPVVVVGQSYSATITASGGTGPYSFAQTGLPLPSLNASTGALSGFTNSAVGDYQTYLTVSDSSSPTLTNTRSYTFKVRNPLTITAVTPPRAAAGIPYNGGSGFQLTASGGQAPFIFTINSGSLPNGLTMSSSGLISGTPSNTLSAGGSYTIDVSASDSLGQVTSASTFVVNVSIPPIVTNLSLPTAVVNTPYAVDIERSGGSNEFNGTDNSTGLVYNISGLPPGLSYGTDTGRIYGTPTSNSDSPYSVSVDITDKYGFTGSKTFSLIVRTAGKLLDLKSAHFSDPCPTSTNCSPTANDIAQLNNDTQQFLVYSRIDTTPRSLQISKIDADGRVQRPILGSNFSKNLPLANNLSTFGNLRIDDIDQDGYKDIIFTDTTYKKLCVLWNSNTVDAYGMPTGFSAANMDCFPIPNGTHSGNTPGAFVVKSDLRPDATNYGKRDIIVTTSSGNNPGSTVFVLRNICPLSGSCTNATTQRPVIFDGFISTTGTTDGTTVVLTTNTSGVIVGMPVVGDNIAAGSTVTAVSTNVSITLSVATIGTGSTKLSLPQATTIPGTTTTINSKVITNTASTAGIFVGQLVSHANFPAGTRIVSFTNDSNITVSNTAIATTAGTAITFYGPVSHSPQIVSAANGYMRDTYNIRTGWLLAAKPNLPSVKATSVDQCPGIIIAGFNGANTTNGYVYLIRQGYNAGTNVCDGEFQTHVANDELLVNSPTFAVSANTPWLSGLEVADFNNDGISDVAVGTATAFANSATVKVYTSVVGSSGFFSGQTSSPQLQSRGTITTGVNKISSYCIDGSSSCSYPALAVTCQANGAYACLAILPNQCSTPGCSTPYETGAPSYRIDYPAPNGQSQELIIKPLVSPSFLTFNATTSTASKTIAVSDTSQIAVGQAITGTNIPNYAYIVSKTPTDITINLFPTGSGSATLRTPLPSGLNDIAFAGVDTNGPLPYFISYARNGSSTTDPLKGATLLDGLPSSFLQNADIGITRLSDGNGDNKLDLFSFSPVQGFVGSFMSQFQGGTTYGLGAVVAPNYLADYFSNGCPNSALVCFPDPIFSPIGVTPGWPSNYYENNTMDLNDINNDGYPDAVAAGYMSRAIAVALGTSTGSFQTATMYQVGGASDFRPRSVVLSDLDQDGIKDLVVTGQQISSGTTIGFASWLKGNGNGTFQTAVGINQILNSCADPRALSAVDLDQDGRPELAVLCYSSQNIWISRRHTDGNWKLQANGTSINSGPGINGTSMYFGRLTSSSSSGLDLVVGGLDFNNSMRIINNVSINITNAASGTFVATGSPSSFYALNGHLADIKIADLNADGYGDIIVGMQTGNPLSAGIYYTCLSVSAGVCNPLGWGMEGVGITSISVGELQKADGQPGTDDTPELILGFRGTGKLIYRTLAKIINLSQ